MTRFVKWLEHFDRKLEKIMSGLDDLKAALAANAAEIDADITSISDKVAALTAAATGDSDADVKALADQLTAETAALKSKVATALNPPATPAPAAPGAGSTTAKP